MEIQNQVRNYECEICHVKPQPGIMIGMYNGIWLCGTCMLKAIKKIEENTRKIIFEE